MRQDNPHFDRRTVLQTASGFSLVGLTGCLSGSGEAGDGTITANDDSDNQGVLHQIAVEGTALVVELGRRYLEAEFVESDDSAAVEAVSYFEHDESRPDTVCLDADGQIVVTLEAKRANHDILTAVPEDYDKMAACELEAAIWVVKNRADAHEVLRALNEPNEGHPRVEKTYSSNSPLSPSKIHQPGITEMHTLQGLQ